MRSLHICLHRIRYQSHKHQVLLHCITSTKSTGSQMLISFRPDSDNMQEAVWIWGSAASQRASASQEAHPACVLFPCMLRSMPAIRLAVRSPLPARHT